MKHGEDQDITGLGVIPVKDDVTAMLVPANAWPDIVSRSSNARIVGENRKA